jgi:hypothetical protein
MPSQPGGADGHEISQHPTDRLIRELIQTGHLPLQGERAQIIERIAAAPFDPRVLPVRQRHRGLTYAGQTLGDRAPALIYHVVQRVVVDRQWGSSTGATDYLEDLHRSVLWPSALLAVYARRGGHTATVLTGTEDVLPAARRGPEWLPEFAVIYSADRGTIVTGYQFSSLATLALPDELRWLQ